MLLETQLPLLVKVLLSAQLVWSTLALFGAYVTRVAERAPSAFIVNILEPFTFAGLLFGAMIPYCF
jgi:Na+/H+-translocating membrane pyrophosphatase